MRFLWARFLIKKNVLNFSGRYGWRRTELLGGLCNGMFLLSMGVFVVLQAIPEIISPTGLFGS